MASGTKEIHFEAHIENYLVNTVKEYHSVSPKLYDKELCVIPSEIIAFVKDTQPKKYAELATQYGALVDAKIVENVAKNVTKNKTLDVLRNGVKDRGQKLAIAYFKPANNKTPEHEAAYAKNRLAIVRQLKYSNRNNNEIDFVLFINGVPVVTAELKNIFTGQNHHNAIKQFMQDRDPKGEPFLDFKRCLVHFAVGTEKVFMATELKGKATYFLPFNKGLENEKEGFAVSYLWEDVLRKDSLLDLVQNFISVQTDKEKIYDAKTKKLIDKKSTKLLFPRFHQRRAVNRILEALKTDGTGKNYLIQHSAGSGKSNTITWLAYRLANFYQHYTDSTALYDSIIVVTDRRVLNKQIQDNIRQLDNTPGVVAYIDEKTTSQDLKKAIEEKKRIIITTIQKFPVISDVVATYSDRNYAILIDEAHSSQSGEASRHMRKTLSLEEATKEEANIKTVDEIITDEIVKKGKQPNISQFAFTATPKPKTIQLFGTKINGKTSAFDEYTMEEAIKEGFIKDVLKNYMSFKRYYKLVKRSEIDDKEYDTKKTVRVLSNYVDLQDHAIEKKARIMIEHFTSHTQNEMQGQARAMLVTKSRLHAVRFKRKFDDIMQEMALPYKTLVAFSGTVTDEETGEDYTESSMNNLGGKISIPEGLKLPANRILIVANKFQTGFDEPLLHTMFVDKKLGGANTVQTLSRLNRNRKGKDSTMVLDFVNDPDLVRKDFQHFYGKNYMEEENETDQNSLYHLLNTVEEFKIYYDDDVTKFAKIFFTPNDKKEDIHSVIRDVVKRFNNELEDEDKATFKGAIKSYIKVYRFLSQIIEFKDVDLEKKYVFLTFLLKALPYIQSNLPLDVVNDIELDSYKIQYKFTTSLDLVSEDGEDYGMSPSSTSQKSEEEIDFLTKIIKVLNDTFGLDLTDEDKVDFNRVKKSLYQNKELMGYFNKQNSKNNIKDKFEEEVDGELLNFINTKLDFYNKMTDDKANMLFKTMLFNEIYNREVRGLGK
ncbi:DEAD/DEAH box helicase family protein [Tenacibaculum ovolyticum]|uniref:type I restriction endonuclease subunit R n=1 Tax=Tenacibaculum ovolyticum TaxID=104270 RepID=UPI0022F39FC5|nr:DEAD/DEAH box helicase family protein [Tenacibaculum ovolyticum]WBX78098.1 DEAD/DEAH box helicase family protein [Tenacibaculum ovolyticum]